MAVASTSRELAQRPTPERPAVDPHDEPSAQWGWHGGFPMGSVVGGVITIILCAVFMIGPYQSRTQDLWLIGVIVIVLGGIVWQIVRRRNAWRR